MHKLDPSLSDLPPSCRAAAERWRSCCPPRGETPRLETYDEILRHYVSTYQPAAAAEMDFYRSLRSLAEVVDWAGNALAPNGRRHSHQRRIPASVLQGAHATLRRTDFGWCHTFEDLHQAVSDLILGIHGIGELMVYDTALRIGAYLGLEPETVYLHAGTRTGARALGLRGEGGRLPMSRLPAALHQLSAREAEDCLCIYKNALANARRQ
jgi:hypothetical protein